MTFTKRFLGHLKTVHNHRKMVRKLCFKCGLYWQGLTHDLSKYHPVEFWNGVKYYTGTASPHVGERAEKGYSDAWVHHHNHNKHHGEYWQDIDKNGKTCPIDMPYEYIQELVCDRVAASMTYLGDALGLPYELTHKTPSDGLCGKTDEDNFGFTYKQLNDYIRFGSCGDIEIGQKIAKKHFDNMFKLEPIPSFKPFQS